MVAHQSTNNSGWTTGTSSVVTKPTGLAVGDLMIGFFFVQSASTQTLPLGFTTLGTRGTLKLGYKFADSGDVAASDFTFTNAVSTRMFSSISRITDASSFTGSIVYNDGFQNSTATPSIAAEVTPAFTRANCLLMQFWNQDTGAGLTSNFAIATSNPTWSEAYDVVDGTAYTMAMGYASRPQTTATGNVSVTGAGSTNWIMQIISIADALNFSVAESVTLTESRKEDQSILKNESVTLTEDVEATKQRMYTNTDKSSTTWINQNK